MEEKLINIDVEEIIDLFKRKWWIVVVITALAAFLSWSKASKMVPSYQGSMKILFSKSDSYMESYSSQEVEMYNQFMGSYREATMISGFLEDSLKQINSNNVLVSEPKTKVENNTAETQVENPGETTSENANEENAQPDQATGETNEQEQQQGDSVEGQEQQEENIEGQTQEQTPGEQQTQEQQPEEEKVESDTGKERMVSEEIKDEEINILAQQIRGVRIAASETYPSYTLSLSSITTEGMQDVLNKTAKVIELNAKQSLSSAIPGIKVKVIQDFYISTSMPNKMKVIIVGIIAGLIISIGLILVLDYLDDKVRTVEQLEKMLPVPVLGDIPQNERVVKKEGKSHVSSK